MPPPERGSPAAAEAAAPSAPAAVARTHVRHRVHGRGYSAASVEENCALVQASAVSDAVLHSSDAYLCDTRRFIDPFWHLDQVELG